MLVGGYGWDIVKANGGGAENFEIGRILHLKFEIGDWTGRVRPTVQFQTSDFEFQVQDSSNFKLSVSPCSLFDIQSEILVVLVTNVFDQFVVRSECER